METMLGTRVRETTAGEVVFYGWWVLLLRRKEDAAQL
jgi:hypothetical protein